MKIPSDFGQKCFEKTVWIICMAYAIMNNMQIF